MDKNTIQWIKSLISHNNVKAFYNSSLWEHKRLEILEKQHNECQVCKDKGEFTPAVTVHHIKFLRNHSELALEDSNLIAVCDECHFEIHHKRSPKPQLNIERW